ncbi:MAG: hypothetical protein KatS3mg111_0152 [Pirellulaceae bacterium]|nr:MAG: hypothetical protein KatS3mg111_0152 [Pirellulaceae bacterium]
MSGWSGAAGRCRRVATVLLLVLSASAGTSPLTAQVATAPSGEAPMHLIVLAGQSNMAGRGEVSNDDLTPHPRIYMLDAHSQWVPAVDPLHFDKPQVVGVGPGRAFALEYARHHPEAIVGLIPCAVGGTSIRLWQPGQRDTVTGAHPWDDTQRRIERAMRDGEVKAILWHQGESDSRSGRGEEYAVALKELIGRFRELIQDPQAPFLIGQLGQFAGRPWTDGRRAIDQAHKLVAREVSRSGFVSSLGLEDKGDGVHFSAAAARELGRRYYREYERITQRKQPEVVSVKRIWDRAPHNAFTDLIRFADQWYCVFREGRGHVSPDGAVRVLVSTDGLRWESAARFQRQDADLRDPKLAITPDGKLMLIAAGAMHRTEPHRHRTFAWYSQDGSIWTSESEIGQPDYWLWRVTFGDRLALGIAYTTNSPQDRHTRLFSSVDGRQWRVHVPRLLDDGYPTEASIQFVNQRAYAVQRRDGSAPQTATGLLGVADPPYDQWAWLDLGVRVGGPALTISPHGKMLAVVRLYDGSTRTAVCEVDPIHGTIEELLVLPSGGDTSYAGCVWRENTLWISYYSGHEARNNAFTTAIYVAQVNIP